MPTDDNTHDVPVLDFFDERLDLIEASIAGLREMVKHVRAEAAAGNDNCPVQPNAYVTDGFVSAMGHLMLVLLSEDMGSPGEVVLACDRGVYLVATLGKGMGLLTGQLLAPPPLSTTPETTSDN